MSHHLKVLKALDLDKEYCVRGKTLGRVCGDVANVVPEFDVAALITNALCDELVLYGNVVKRVLTEFSVGSVLAEITLRACVRDNSEPGYFLNGACLAV